MSSLFYRARRRTCPLPDRSIACSDIDRSSNQVPKSETQIAQVIRTSRPQRRVLAQSDDQAAFSGKSVLFRFFGIDVLDWTQCKLEESCMERRLSATQEKPPQHQASWADRSSPPKRRRPKRKPRSEEDWWVIEMHIFSFLLSCCWRVAHKGKDSVRDTHLAWCHRESNRSPRIFLTE